MVQLYTHKHLTDVAQFRLIGLHTTIEHDKINDQWILSVANSNVIGIIVAKCERRT